MYSRKMLEPHFWTHLWIVGRHHRKTASRYSLQNDPSFNNKYSIARHQLSRCNIHTSSYLILKRFYFIASFWPIATISLYALVTHVMSSTSVSTSSDLIGVVIPEDPHTYFTIKLFCIYRYRRGVWVKYHNRFSWTPL